MINLGAPNNNQNNFQMGRPDNAPNSFTLPNNQRSPFLGFNDAGWRDIQSRTEREGRRATLQEYTSMGGNVNDYHKIYGGLAPDGYSNLQAQYESKGGKIPYSAWVEAGGNPNDYGKLYGDNLAAVQGDPYQNIFANQLQSNYTQAGIDSQLNRINEYNPYGSSQYITNPDGSVSRVSQLSQPNQQLLDQQYGADYARGNIAQNMLQGYGQSYAPMSQDYLGEANRVENQMFSKLEGDINKNFDRDQERLRSQLLNAGISAGTERYAREMENFNRTKADAINSARLSAIGAGREQGSYLLNQEMQRRNQPLSEMAALNAQIRGVQTPSFSGNYNVQMPYVDMATPSIANANQRELWAREDMLRPIEWAREEQMMREQARLARAGRGSGRSGGGMSQLDAAMMQLLMNGGGGSSPSPFMQGLTAMAPIIGQGIGNAIVG